MDKIKKNKIKLLSILFVILSIYSITPWIALPIKDTTIWWIFEMIFIYELIGLKKLFFLVNNRKRSLVIFFFFYWCLFCSLRGVFSAENYWDWKLLISTTLIFLLPLTINISGNPIVLPFLLNNWLKYIIFIFSILFPFFQGTDPRGQLLAPFCLLLLFFFELDFRWKCISLFAFVVVIVGIDSRSQVVKFLAAFGLSNMFFLYKNVPQFFKVLISPLRLLFLILPFILFTLAVTNVFNIFKVGENSTAEDIYANDDVESSVKADTRTGLYLEVLKSALDNKYVIWGRTPSQGYDSFSLGKDVAAATGIEGRKTRDSCEVSILNIFNYYGAVGVGLYFLIFFVASGLAVNKSNNVYIKLIGLFVAFRWCFAWIEDFSNFNLEYFMLWVMIGMCLSENFRKMSDNEFKSWINSIFIQTIKKPRKVFNLKQIPN